MKNGVKQNGSRYTLNPPAINNDPLLQGIFFEIIRGEVHYHINNLIDLFPNRSVRWIDVRVLRRLHEVGILNPGSRSSFYRVSKECFFDPKVDVRFDYRSPGRMHDLRVDFFARHTPGGGVFKGSRYMNPKNARTRVYVYRKEDFWRLEMVVPIKDADMTHSAYQLVEDARPMNVLNHRNHRAVKRLMAPVLAREIVPLNHTEFIHEGAALFRLAHGGYGKKRL